MKIGEMEKVVLVLGVAAAFYLLLPAFFSKGATQPKQTRRRPGQLKAAA